MLSIRQATSANVRMPSTQFSAISRSVVACVLVLSTMLPLAGCLPSERTAGADPTIQLAPTLSEPTVAARMLPSPRLITITGWFVTVWNGEPHYSLTDDQGNVSQLLLDPDVSKSLGGPLAFDRKRVTIVARVASESPPTLRVISIKIEASQ